MKNWKTTIVGLIVIAIGVLHTITAHKVDAEALGELSTGAGLIVASDANRQS